MHRPKCIPEHVTGIIITCSGDRITRPIFSTVDIGRAHEIHQFGVPCPVSRNVGLPLVIYRHLRENPMTMHRTPDLDNQIATYLMIDPESGFAPPEYVESLFSALQGHSIASNNLDGSSVLER